ncbi:MAG: lysine--tRNA ligase [Anaerolineae bacterium]
MNTDSEELSDLERKRLLKLERIRARGIDPYPSRVERSHTNAQALSAFQAAEAEKRQPPEVTVVGRLCRMNEMGRATFAHIEDGTGRIQLYFRKDEVGPEAYEFLEKDFDLGDFLQAEGHLFRTKTGEITVHVRNFHMLSKALRPLPVVKEKDGVIYDAFSDKEARYRQRYVDLAVNEHVRRIFVTRTQIISALRRFFEEHGFLEVETPILQPIYGGAAARPFITYHNQLHQDLYLRIAPELYLKRLLVGGYERVYEIGKNFRNEGVDLEHNPEFTSAEFYMAYADYRDVMDLTEEMLVYVAKEVLGTLQITYKGHEIDLTPPWPRRDLRQTIIEETGIDYKEYPDAQSLYQAILGMGVKVEPKPTRGKLIDFILNNYIEPRLIQPTFLLDYPLEVSPLAKKKPEDPETVERFELFIGGMEICNAFTELNDPTDQKERFLAQSQAFAAGDEEAHQMDEDYILALSYGMPPAGGWGMGVDRFVMLLTNQPSIREVILFPHLRARED